MTTASPLKGQTSASGVLAELLEKIAQAIEAGQPVDIETYCQAHPHHADQIRRLLPALVALNDAGLSALERPSGGEGARASSCEIGGILGDFRILHEVGRGGMGIVYKAEQMSLRRIVALKVLPFASVLDLRQTQRFENEARAAACLHHPHIVPVHSVGCERGVHYYAMQYVEGCTLAQVIHDLKSQGGAVPPNAESSSNGNCYSVSDPSAPTVVPGPVLRQALDHDARSLRNAETHNIALTTSHGRRGSGWYRCVAELGIQLADGLDYAHSVGVIHRDIKPANVLIDVSGHAWITDFGLARLDSDGALSITGDMLGTLRYMSPEQALGQSGVLNHRTDIYSLGATLYELLAQRPAFTEVNRAKLIQQVTGADPPRLRTLDPAVPKDLQTIIGKMMAKDARDRYSSARNVADDFRRFLDHRPITARPVGATERALKWGRRHIFVLSATLAASVFCSLVLAASTVWGLSERNAARKAESDSTRQAIQAQANLKVAIDTVSTLLIHISDHQLFSTPGGTRLRLVLLHEASQKLDVLCRDQENPELLVHAASAFRRGGQLLIQSGKYSEALAPLNAARRALDKAHRFNPQVAESTEYVSESSQVDFCFAAAKWYAGDLQAALPHADAAVSQLSKAQTTRPNDALRSMLLHATRQRGHIHLVSQRYREAEADFQASNRLRLPVGNLNTSRERIIDCIDECGHMIDLAYVRDKSGDPAGALALLDAVHGRARRTESEATRLEQEGSPDSGGFPLPLPYQLQWLTGDAWVVMGDVHARRGDTTAAAEAYLRGAKVLEQVAAKFPDIHWTVSRLVDARVKFARVRNHPTQIQHLQGVFDGFVTSLSRSENLKAAPFQNHEWNELIKQYVPKLYFPEERLAILGDTDHVSVCGRIAHIIGLGLYREGKYAEARAAVELAMELSRDGNYAGNAFIRAMAEHRLQNNEEALSWYQKAVGWMECDAPLDEQQRLGRLRAEAEAALDLSNVLPSEN